MAVYNPSLFFPVNVGINGDDDNTFFGIFNKDADDPSVQTQYQLFIYELDNTLAYDSTLITSPNEFHLVPGSTLPNGNTYKWKVDSYVGATKYSSKYKTFTTVSDATLNIDTLPVPFEHQFYTFTATYIQPESIEPKSSKWRLYDSLDTLIFESPEIIGLDIEFEIEGFEDSTTYKIECEVTNQRDITTISPRLTFTPLFDVPEGTPDITLESDNCTGTITVGWENLVIQSGSVEGTSSYTSGKFNLGLQLNPNSCLVYDLVRGTTEEFTLNMWLKLDTTFDGNIVELYKDGELFYRVGYNNVLDRFFYERDYRITAGDIIAIPTVFFLLSVTNDRIYYEIGGTKYEVY